MLSEALGDEVDVTLIDQGDAFVFGFSKLDVHVRPHHAARRSACPTGRSQSPACVSCGRPSPRSTRRLERVTTDAGEHEADVLVIALGADYDMDATPGLAEGGNEFYSVAGAAAAGAEIVPTFSAGTR